MAKNKMYYLVGNVSRTPLHTVAHSLHHDAAACEKKKKIKREILPKTLSHLHLGMRIIYIFRGKYSQTVLLRGEERRKRDGVYSCTS